jgi:hypothetical protein
MGLVDVLLKPLRHCCTPGRFEYCVRIWTAVESAEGPKRGFKTKYGSQHRTATQETNRYRPRPSPDMGRARGVGLGCQARLCLLLARFYLRQP